MVGAAPADLFFDAPAKKKKTKKNRSKRVSYPSRLFACTGKGRTDADADLA